MARNKFVLDTNIWISCFLKSEPDKLFTSDALIKELEVTLQKKKISRFLVAPVEEFISFHKSISIQLYPDQIHTFFTDPKDNFLIDLAMKAKADYIVSGDRQVLKVSTYKKVHIISLRQFKDLLRSRGLRWV